ncbi:MAG: alpha/beta hydrolase [Nakamurella sp.]
MSHKGPSFSSSRPSMEYLGHRGPNEVVSGDLTEIGVRGIVFAPHTGPRCAAVVFGHGYLQPAERYVDTLRFLASWGFVAAAPDTERGIVPSHSGLALDLARAADRLSDAKLNNGRVTIDANRLAAVGHGIGGGAAVLAAATGRPPIKAVATIFASDTSPSAIHAAAHVSSPGLHLTGGADRLADAESGGEAIARAWGGPAQLRRIKGAHSLSITEGRHVTSRLLDKHSSQPVLRTVRMLLTAFLLVHVADQDQLGEQLDGKISRSTLIDITDSTAVGVAR